MFRLIYSALEYTILYKFKILHTSSPSPILKGTPGGGLVVHLGSVVDGFTVGLPVRVLHRFVFRFPEPCVYNPKRPVFRDDGGQVQSEMVLKEPTVANGDVPKQLKKEEKHHLDIVVDVI